MSNQKSLENLQTTVFVDPQLLIRNGKLEEIDNDGHLLSPCAWKWANCFQEGLAPSDDNSFVDQNGELVIEDKWSPCGMGFSEGVAPTEEGYIDHSGRVVIPDSETAIGYNTILVKYKHVFLCKK